MDIPNQKLDLAFQYIEHTNKNVFLTGKAGTGKTTFLKKLKATSAKRIAVVAPTGVAAINAGGVTIHSMFQLSFAPFIPGQPTPKEKYQFSTEKIRTLRGLDLLVIDEISMVRADVLDAIDQVLRKYRSRFKPFGGLQILMIGDLHQLAPVVKEDEWQLLQPHYASMYFFDSLSLKQSDFITIELSHIYRQSDAVFISLLNKVRDKVLDPEAIALLNSRYQTDLSAENTKGYIHLTTHNHAAQVINKNRLDSLTGTMYSFKAEITGEFPENAYPNDHYLELKIGAQVMFVKNDAKDRMYYNGKLGVITAIDKKDDILKIKCEGEQNEIAVSKTTWENIKYVLTDSKELTESILGSFTQFPVKAAWAITIHKSQGLTFDRAIIDAQASFAHGQVYVALSRCKTLEGLVLSSPIHASSIKSDKTITGFHEVANQVELNESGLFQAKKTAQIDWLKDIFDLSVCSRAISKLNHLIENDHTKLTEGVRQKMNELYDGFMSGVDSVISKFNLQLPTYFSQDVLPEENAQLQERIIKGASYFYDYIKYKMMVPLQALDLDCDNKELAKTLWDQRQYSLTQLKTKLSIMEVVKSVGFQPIAYLQAKANTLIDVDKEVKKKKEKVQKSDSEPAANYTSGGDPKNVYVILKDWRDHTADTNQLQRYQVLPQKTIKELSEQLPADIRALKKIHGLGEVRIKQYGEEILKIIREYCTSQSISLVTHSDERDDIPVKVKKTATGQTQAVSYELFKEGLSIEEIARRRNLNVTTVESHLSGYIKNGSIDVLKLVPEEKLFTLQKYIMNHSNAPLKEIKESMGENYTYGEIKMVLASLGL